MKKSSNSKNILSFIYSHQLHIMSSLQFLASLILCAILFSSLSAHQWHRLGLGRTIHVFSQNVTSDILLLTSLATVARVDAQTSAIRWRILPPLASGPVRPLAATSLSYPHPPYLLVLLSDRTVRAIDPIKAAIVWHLSACRLGVIQGNSIPIATCDGRIHWLNPSNGLPSDPLVPDASFTELPNLPDTAYELQWPSSRYVLTSASDGALRLIRDKQEAWRREDGVAHVSAGSIFSIRDTSIVVVLSDLGALYALDEDGSIMWKVPVGRRCILLDALVDRAVVVCTEGDETHVRAIRVADGTVFFTKTISNFRAARAAIDRCCGEEVCVVAVDAVGIERWISQCDADTYADAAGAERGWLLYSKGGREVRGVRGGATIWRVVMPNSAVISAVVTARSPHPVGSTLRPPPVRVTGSRKLLRKVVDENTILILARDDHAAEVHAMIIDSNTGSLYNVFSHSKGHAPLAGVRGDNWFVYTFWNSLMLQQEVHVVEMYHRTRKSSWVGETVRAAVRTLFGPELMSAFGIPDPGFTIPCQPPTDNGTDSLQCSKPEATHSVPRPNPKPVLMRASSLLTQRVVALDVTETAMGITESAVIMTLESGQVSLVPKFLLDARRSDGPSSVALPSYEPVLQLESSARKSVYVAEGIHISGIKKVAVAPHHERESSTQIAVLGLDIVFSLMQPVGSFDSLPKDFLYSAVVAMIIFLAGGVIYTHRLKVRSNLAKSW